MSTSGTSCLTLIEFPDDVLYLIFSRCDIQTLGRLSQVCKRFWKLITKDCVWLPFIGDFSIIRSSQTTCNGKKPLREQCRIAKNWIDCVFHEKSILRHNSKQLPWLQYTNRKLWVSTGNTINSYTLRSDGSIQGDHHLTFRVPREDISRFVVKNDKVISGCRDGSIHMWDALNGNKLYTFPHIHRTDSQAVDFYDQYIVSGSRDKTVKIVSTSYEHNSNCIRQSFDVGDRIWSIAISPDGSTFTAGTAGNLGGPSSLLWDVQSGSLLYSLGKARRGAGILDIKYESPNILLTCGYDTFIRMWDTRTGKCVSEWEEPFDNALYCLQSDSYMTMVTGTSRYGMTRLWDKRKTQPVQAFYSGQRNSPVYCVVFDSSRLYIALDVSVIMLDFSVY
ncbi:hypothetical protein CHS0354_041300 [Potamilus streckersoni]|uniref:F-box domain-containing protein n=1 Tax=Potamilus streckersoni TaxID=2493646 RepID=A0AAE0VTN8_9BIVA|nr:hypothetical protein CHS0354_041300 [Potamilus streckersoni]